MEWSHESLPLVIGVTGHRDLRDDDLPRLILEVTEIITRIKRDYHGDETPIVLLSALAEGADRLVARVALSQGAWLVAPMPMPIDEYRRDFQPGLWSGAAAEFDELIAKAAAIPIVPFTAGNSLEAVRNDSTKRDEQYRAVGIFIVRHCHVLIALWDGNDRGSLVGGTAEIVAFKRNGIPLGVLGVRQSLDGSEIGPVIHVVTPRAKGGDTATGVTVRPWGRNVTTSHEGRTFIRLLRRIWEFAGHVCGLQAHDVGDRLAKAEKQSFETWRRFADLTALTRRFNDEAATLEDAASKQKSLDELFWDFDNNSCDREAQKRATELASHWCNSYKVADLLAQKRQRKFKFDWRLLFTLGFAALVCFEIFAHLSNAVKHLVEPHVEIPLSLFHLIFLGGYFLIFLFVFRYFIKARIGQHQERFLDYRALAEALRVAIFWKLTGVGAPAGEVSPPSSGSAPHAPAVRSIADAYPIKQPNELAWVKTCLQTLELFDNVRNLPAVSSGLDQKSHEWALRLWVRGQWTYFDKQRRKHNHTAEVRESRAFIALAISPFMLAPWLIWLDWHRSGRSEWDNGYIRDLFIFALGVLPGIAAVLVGYTEQLAFKAQARQYDRMSGLFKRAYELLTEPEKINLEQATLVQEVYAELGLEAMKEHGEWVALYRQRPIRPPQS